MSAILILVLLALGLILCASLGLAALRRGVSAEGGFTFDKGLRWRVAARDATGETSQAKSVHDALNLAGTPPAPADGGSPK